MAIWYRRLHCSLSFTTFGKLNLCHMRTFYAIALSAIVLIPVTLLASKWECKSAQKQAIVMMSEKTPTAKIYLCGKSSQEVISESCTTLQVLTDVGSKSGFTVVEWEYHIPEAEFSSRGNGAEVDNFPAIFDRLGSGATIYFTVAYKDAKGDVQKISEKFVVKK